MIVSLYTTQIAIDRLFSGAVVISFKYCPFNRTHFKKLEFADKDSNFISNNQLCE